MKIAASILAADFSALGEGVRAAADGGCDWLHLDVMDGHYVPNLSFGPPVIRSLRPLTALPFDVHLMVERPEDLLPQYIDAGANFVTVHAETCTHLHRTLTQIRSLGAGAGVALNPATPLAVIEEVLDELDLLLIMSVNPGFGGQSFIPRCLDKIRACREMLDRAGSGAELSIDGGVQAINAGAIVAAGASVLVVGSAIYGHPGGLPDAVHGLRIAAEGLHHA